MPKMLNVEIKYILIKKLNVITFVILKKLIGYMAIIFVYSEIMLEKL